MGTIDASTGTVSGIAGPGVITITYTVTNGAGCSDFSTYAVSVNVTNAGTISGTTTICPFSFASVTWTNSDFTADPGAWTSSNTSIATIGTYTGVVTGVSAGTTTISYTTLESWCPAYITQTVTVLSAPSFSAISGASTLSVSGASSQYSVTITGGASSPTYNWVTVSPFNVDFDPGSTNTTTDPYFLAPHSGATTPIYVEVTDAGGTGCMTMSAQKWITTVP